MRAILMTSFFTVFPIAATAQDGLIIVDPTTDKYLGNLNSNRYDPNSVVNPYGRYGSPYSADSINNPYGQYGSPYSSNSANNPYTSKGPIIIEPGYNGLLFGN